MNPPDWSFQNRPVRQDGASDCDALALPSGELDAALTDQRVVSLRQPHDERRDMRLLGGPADRPHVRIGLPVTDVLCQRPVEQDWILRHQRYRTAQRRARLIFETMAPVKVLTKKCSDRVWTCANASSINDLKIAVSNTL